MSPVGEGHVDRADRFGFRSAARSGKAGCRKGVLGAGDAAGAFRHGHCDGFAHRAVHGEQTGGNTEGLFLGLVAISDVTGKKDLRSAGHIGQACGQRTAGA